MNKNIAFSLKCMAFLCLLLLSSMYVSGQQVSDRILSRQDLKQLTALADGGDADAQFRLSTHYLEEGNLRMGIPLMRKAAIQGHVYAQEQFAGFFKYGICDSKNPGENAKFQLFLSNERYNDCMAAALWWFRRASDRSLDARFLADDIAEHLNVIYPDLPSDSFAFPFEIPRIYQIEFWCHHYETLCRKQLPAMLHGYDVPQEMLKYDPCLVWLILKNPDWDHNTKNHTMDAYKMNIVKSTYELYAQLLRKQYDLSLPPMQKMD